MDSRLLDVNPVLRSQQIHHFDDTDESTTIQTVTDVTDIVEDNKRAFNDAPSSIMQGGVEFRRVASIPMGLLFQLKKQGISDDPARFKAWLNERDNRVFRTTAERV